MENGVKPNIQFSAIVLPIVKYFAKAISWEPFVGRTVPENYRNRLELVEMLPAGKKNRTQCKWNTNNMLRNCWTHSKKQSFCDYGFYWVTNGWAQLHTIVHGIKSVSLQQAIKHLPGKKKLAFNAFSFRNAYEHLYIHRYSAQMLHFRITLCSWPKTLTIGKPNRSRCWWMENPNVYSHHIFAY